MSVVRVLVVLTVLGLIALCNGQCSTDVRCIALPIPLGAFCFVFEGLTPPCVIVVTECVGFLQMTLIEQAEGYNPCVYVNR